MLYNDYRPLHFDEVEGQSENIHTLKNQAIKGDFGQSYLFSGHRGTGKTTVARILARAINCLSPTESGPCNECENCRAILNNESLDYTELDAAANNGVDQIKELISTTSYIPSRLKKKIYIIDEVHNLSSNAFDSLLKTIEEPPEHCIFILCTTELHKVPATIKSRCEPYIFSVISIDTIVKRLKYVLTTKGIAFEESALVLIAKHSDGALRDALSILDKIISTTEEKIIAEQVIKHLSLIDEETIIDIIYNIIRRNTADACKKLEHIAGEGKSLQMLTDGILSALADMIVLYTTKKKKSLSIKNNYADSLNYIINHTSIEELFWLVNQFTNLRELIRNSLNPFVEVQLYIIKTSCKELIKEDFSYLATTVAKLQKDIQDLNNKINSFSMSANDSSSFEYQKNIPIDVKENRESKVEEKWESDEVENPLSKPSLEEKKKTQQEEGGEGPQETDTPEDPFLSLLGLF